MKNEENSMISLFLSQNTFRENGDFFFKKGNHELAFSCYNQLGIEHSSNLLLEKFGSFNLKFEDYVFYNFCLLNNNLRNESNNVTVRLLMIL